ncbi:site-specific integrase [Shewanella livingstonensis]|uniref:Site-specific integrase n=1 Tax=Shewanella livingstonensis TaxID=150120 RepID=A0A3G8LXK5_9GAMM|nr:site-specific integrase [Shewanella livingstonensis]AZG74483.1 site-specific integrase [Shewanella livingstonensis]
MSNNIGVERRSKERARHQKHIIAKAEQITAKHFPNGKQLPLSTEFNDKWQSLLEDIQKSFSSFIDLRTGFNQCVKIINVYIYEAKLTLEPLSYLVFQKAEKSIRNQDWMRQSYAFQSLYTSWFEQVKNAKTKQGVADIFRSVLLSFICHSGCCNYDLVKSFAKKLAGKLDLKQINNASFISLTIDSAGYNTNIKNTEKTETIYHCYLSPLTLAFIKQLNSAQNEERYLSWIKPNDSKTLHALLTKGYQVELPNLAQSLKKLCISAIGVVESLPNININQAILEYATGRNKSYSLPLDNLARLQTKPTSIISTPISFKRIDIPFKKDTIEHRSILPSKEFFKCLTHALRENGIKKLSRKALSTSLESLAAQHQLSLAQRTLLSWLLLKSQTCKPSTIRSYHSTLSRKWLLFSEYYQLSIIDEQSMLALYHQLIDNTPTQKQKCNLAARLNDFHAHAAREFDFPLLSEAIYSGDKNRAHTNAGFIDETLFKALLGTVLIIDDLDHEEKATLQAALIISFRCGLRISEVIKLRLSDIENSSTAWLEIRENQYGNNKSHASLRRVPLYPLLLEDEKKIVKQVLNISKLSDVNNTKSKLALGFGINKSEPIDKYFLSYFTKTMLRELSGLEHYVFHHLRHSAISRLQLMCELEDAHAVIPEAVPYSKSLCEKIIHLISGNSTRNRYYSIASFDGHSDPEVCFSNYFHFSDFILGHKLSKMHLDMTQKQMFNIGLAPRRYIKALSDNKPDECPLVAQQFSRYLAKKIHISNICTVNDGSVISSNDTSSTQKLVIPQAPSLNTCYVILQQINSGLDPREVSHKFHIDHEIIQKWYRNAVDLRKITTRSGKPRLRAYGNGFLPQKPSSLLERRWLTTLIDKIRLHFKYDNRNLIKVIKFALQNTSQSKSGVYFSSPEELTFFIDTFAFAIPKNKWRVVTFSMEHASHKTQWQNAYKGIQSIVHKKSSSIGKEGRGAVRLELRHSNEKEMMERRNQRKHSSNSLVYLLHMAGIMMFNP